MQLNNFNRLDRYVLSDWFRFEALATAMAVVAAASAAAAAAAAAVNDGDSEDNAYIINFYVFTYLVFPGLLTISKVVKTFDNT